MLSFDCMQFENNKTRTTLYNGSKKAQVLTTHDPRFLVANVHFKYYRIRVSFVKFQKH